MARAARETDVFSLRRAKNILGSINSRKPSYLEIKHQTRDFLRYRTTDLIDDPLVELMKSAFRRLLKIVHKKARKSNAGARPKEVLMFIGFSKSYGLSGATGIRYRIVAASFSEVGCPPEIAGCEDILGV